MQEQIRVKTFGRFSLEYNGQLLQLEKGMATKADHLLQYLVCHWQEKFTKEELVSLLYEEGEVSDPINNLKVNIFRLRKMLSEAHLPDTTYILYRRGCYSWNPELPVELDVVQFDTLLDQAEASADPGEKKNLYRQALALYQGDFLPLLWGEEWVVLERIRCQSRYLEGVETLCGLYAGENNYDEYMTIARAAALVCPHEERVYLLQLYGLMNQRRYRETLALYDEVSTFLMDELGVSPSSSMLDIYRRISEAEDIPLTSLADIRSYMQEREMSPGAYHCSYPVFTESCQVISRLLERSGQSAFLLLCTLRDSKGMPLHAGTRLRDAARALHEAIRSSLRRGDLYTRYGPGQFLLLLVGINRENCERVAGRIDEQFRASAGSRGIRLKWEYDTAASPDMSGEKLRFASGGSWKQDR